MESLNCYSLYESKITPGIAVDDFESIITVEPGTPVIKQAVLETSPILDKTAQKFLTDFRLMAGMSLTFIHEVTGKSTKSKSGCLLAVNPKRWGIAASAVSAAIVDPCGLNGHVILFLRSDTPYVLSDLHNRSKVVMVHKTGMPAITTISRASLMRAALANPSPTISKPARCLVAPR